MKCFCANRARKTIELANTRDGQRWSHDELLIAFALYCRTPFGRIHSQNPEISSVAQAIGRTPGALCMKMSNLASLDPTITSTGRVGLRKSSRADRNFWVEMCMDWEAGSIQAERVLRSLGLGSTEGDGNQIPTDLIDAVTDSQSLRTIRIGQRFFRRAVINAYGGKCCISGLSATNLLIASHIVPWKVDKVNRLNPSNGLLLSALHDRAFDRGLITIGEELQVIVSRQHRSLSDDFFKSAIQRFEGQQLARPSRFEPRQDFLAYHRTHVFMG